MLGAVLRVGLLAEPDPRAAQAANALSAALRRGPPKVQWNAAAAIAAALACPAWASKPSPLGALLVEAASAALGASASFKVRIQCAAALLVPAGAAGFVEAAAGADVRAAVAGARRAAAREAEEGRVPRKEEGHWRELGRRLGEVEARLEGVGEAQGREG